MNDDIGQMHRQILEADDLNITLPPAYSPRVLVDCEDQVGHFCEESIVIYSRPKTTNPSISRGLSASQLSFNTLL